MVLTHIYVGALVFGRITGLIIAMPGLSMRTMPTMVRIIMIVCITIILVPTMPMNAEYQPGLLELVFNSATEFLLGFR